MRLWLVYGQCGQYEDFREWVVVACLSEESAEALRDRCIEWARAVGMGEDQNPMEQRVFPNDGTGWSVLLDVAQAVNDGLLPDAPDQSIRYDTTGIKYSFYACDVHPPTATEAAYFCDALVREAATIRPKPVPRGKR